MAAMIASLAMMIYVVTRPNNGWGNGFQCEPEERSDGKHVIFKEVKE